MDKYNLDYAEGLCVRAIDTALSQNDVVKNTDGSISVYTSGKPFILSKICCSVLAEKTGENYFFDLNTQKCMWSTPTQCDSTESPIKIVLNSNGSDGSIFEINNGEDCGLRVDFDFLVKLSCESLAKAFSVSSRLASTPQTQEIIDLKNTIDANVTLCEQLTAKISSVAEEFVNVNYSVVCEDFPFNSTLMVKEVVASQTINPLSETQLTPFGKTAFGSLAPMSFAVSTRKVIFCLTEPDGLNVWQRILGANDYKRFLDGDITSYTTKQVVDLYNENEIILKQSGSAIIFECKTPFGYKTQLKQELDKLINEQSQCNSNTTSLRQNLNAELAINTSSGCNELIDYFENFSATMSIDLVNNDGSLTTIYEQGIFPLGTTSTIGSGNLYNYLLLNKNNSGFYVCGQPNTQETWADGCTPLNFTEFGNQIQPQNVPLNDNVSSCLYAKGVLEKALYNTSGLDSGTYEEQNLFYKSLQPDVLASQWLHFTHLINESDFAINPTNKKVKLSINVKNNCGNFCILVDQINLQKECSKVDKSSLFLSESPGFKLTKVIDNKKSWLNNTQQELREFDINNVYGTNPIRQTEYDINDDRLIVNTKEIDLNMNIASAVEYDVWNYMTQNPCLLTGETCTTLEPTDVKGNPVVLPNYVGSVVNCNDIYADITVYFKSCSAKGVKNNGIFCYPQIEYLSCGKTLKINLGSTASQELWVTCEPTNEVGFYYITNNSDTQNNIFNVTPSFNSTCIQTLTTLINKFNVTLLLSNPDKVIEVFWTNDKTCDSCSKSCGDKNIDFSTFLTDDITQIKTIENFEVLLGDFIDAKTRKTLSGYPTLRAIYNRYLNSGQYCGTDSLAFDYYKMDMFSNLITTYWDDLIEQVIPSTTLWGSVKVYTNTLFDQQKFKYKSYTSLFCNSPLNFVAPPSPINGSLGQCHNVEVITSIVPVFSAITNPNSSQTFDNLCLTQMNWGSEFVGNVDIQDGTGNYLNNDSFCFTCRKAVWYSMPEPPDYLMTVTECGGIDGNTATTFVINSFTISSVQDGSELIQTPLTSDTVNTNSVIWVPANNEVISGCTFGNPTGWTYTNFVDFLNETFSDLGLTQYEARLSYNRITTQILADGTDVGLPAEKARTGFYLIFPENDIFQLSIYCTSQNDVMIYKNDTVLWETEVDISITPQSPYRGSSRAINFAVNYDCKKNIFPDDLEK